MTASMKNPILIVPGWQNSGPEHWQSLWEKKLKAKRVVQREWMRPQRFDWISHLEKTVKSQAHPPFIVAHSLGCHTSALVSALGNAKIRALFLVCPPDLERESVPEEIVGFLPLHKEKLPIPSLLVASNNDPYCDFNRSKEFAQWWGSEFVDAGAQGHINAAAQLGDWEAGLQIFQKFVQRLEAETYENKR